MKRKKSKTTHINVSITHTSGKPTGRPAMTFSMNDLLGQRKNLKKAKKRKKIIDDKGHFEADDEVGFFFEEMKQLSNELEQLFETEVDDASKKET
mgnify:CR=1 FL=1